MPLAFWNLMSAALGAPPNFVVSLPGEPGPLEATRYPLALSHCCSALTSAPVIPNSRLRAKAAVTVPVVALPLSAALTLSIVAWSAPKDESSERMASTWVVESPDAGADAAMIGKGEPPPPPPPLLLLVVPTRPAGAPLFDDAAAAAVSHAVPDRVTVTATPQEKEGMVTVVPPLLELEVRPQTAGSVVTERRGALMVILEPACRVAVKLLESTVIDSTVALELVTGTEAPLTESVTSVVSVTSLYAANARAGAKSPRTAAVLRSVRMALCN